MSYNIIMLLASIAVIALVAFFFKRSSNSNVPGPSHLFGFGPHIVFIRYLWFGIPEATAYYLNKYGDKVKVWIAGEPTLITSSPSIVHHILKVNGTRYTARFGNSTGLRHLGMYNNGIIWNNDVKSWKMLRSFFQKALNSNILADAVPISVEASKHMLQKIPELKNRTEDGSIEALNFIRRITLAVTNGLMLRVNISDDEGLVEKIVQYFKAWEYFLIRPPVMYVCSKEFRKHNAAIKALQEAVQDIVENKKKNMSLHKRNPDDPELDFAEQLLISAEKGEITEAHIHQCILEMLLAGTDTSSVTIYYLLVALSENSEVEEAVMEELQQQLGDKDITKNDLPKLITMEKAIKESMRVKPVGPVIMRKALEKDAVDGINIEKGTNIILHVAQMHRREDIFPNGDDFLPEQHFAKNLDQEYYPFGAGPKGCVGQFLAMVEMKAILATLLRQVKFKSKDQTLKSMETRWDVAQQPTEPSFMYLEQRRL